MSSQEGKATQLLEASLFTVGHRDLTGLSIDPLLKA